MSKSYTHGVAIENWDWGLKREVKLWLVESFGVNGGRWKHEHDYGLESLEMDEDVYMAYLLRWA